MPPPLFRLGQIVNMKTPIPARQCLSRGYKKISFLPGNYTISEIFRNMKFHHIAEMSDGYTYRIYANFGVKSIRISVWQNDLLEGIEE